MSIRNTQPTNPKILNLQAHQNLTVTDDPTTQAVYRQALWLGVVGGLRSMMPLAQLALSGEAAPTTGRLSTIQIVAGVAALGELVGDKLPTTPGRLQPPSLLGRLTIGATAGALLCRRYHQPVLGGIIRGALGAAAGSVAGYAYRTLASQSTAIPDVVWASIEDAVAIGLGRLAVRDPAILAQHL